MAGLRLTLGPVGALALFVGSGCVGPNPNFGTTSEGMTETGSTSEDSTSSDPSSSTTIGPTTTSTSTSTSTSTTGGLCGNGELNPGEECDDGDLNGSEESMCDEDCTVEIETECGDGVVEMGEECDDGNEINGDGCDEDCKSEPDPQVCGDGVLVEPEECDDGNNVDGDGCQGDCTFPPPECGNGIFEEGEECDDGNDIDDDACDNMCMLVPMPECLPPEAYPPCDGDLNKADIPAPFQAIGVGCSENPEDSIVISAPSFNAADLGSWEIAKGIGTYHENNDPQEPLVFSPREGDAFLVLSTGKITDPGNDGVITEAPGSQAMNGENGNSDDDLFLPEFSPMDDMANVLEAQWALGNNNPNDRIWFGFSTVSPPKTFGFSVDFVLQSAEWPVWVETAFNDLFVIWVVTESFTGTATVIDGQPPTVTSLHKHWTSVELPAPKTCDIFVEDQPGYSCTEPQLAGTGFEGNASTTWLRLARPMPELKPLDIYFFLADMSDTALATQVIIDRFRWLCDPCIQANHPLCQGTDPDPNCCGLPVPSTL